MKICFDLLRDAISRIDREDRVREELSAATMQTGFDGFAYLDCQTSWTLATSDYPREWQHHYFQSGYDKLDPIVATAKSRNSAFTWVTELGIKRASPEVRRFWAEAWENNIRSGLTIPIRTSHGHRSMLTFASRRADVAPNCDIDVVAAAAVVGELHGRMKLLKATPTAETEFFLRPNERNFLDSIAQGKTMPEIARLQNIKYNSIKVNVENAKKRCGAVTTPQLVAMAIRRKWIS